MKLLCHLLALGSLVWAPHARAQELNVLVIGSTRSFSEGGESGVVHEKPFNPTGIANHLRSILTLDTAITTVTPIVNVVFEDIYKTKSQTVNYSGSSVYDFTSHCYSLAQHYFWPDGKAARLANLRGEGTYQWDYIVLCNDPYVMANFPGMVAEGVKLIREEVAKSANPAQVVLLAQWPENSSGFTADRFNEIAHRVGDSAGITVVPAGKAWNSYTSQDTSAAHPTPRGEYLAAAAIYSKLFNRSAQSSGYLFPSDGNNIANHANSVVQANAGVPQYAGIFTIINPFQMKQVTKRVVSFRETGTSTEDRLADALHRLDDIYRITFVQNQGSFWDFNYGRGNDWWEDDKDYEVNPAKHDRAYGFPMHHYTVANALNTMPYGIDKHYYYGSTYEDGTDLGIAYNMIRPGTRELSLPEDVRAIPIRLMWQKMTQFSPGFNPLGDNTHMHNHLNDASAAFMYTLLSGRCPVVDEPAAKGSTAWLQWLGHKIGYETAWQMSRLTTRTPGFRVLPSSVAATTVTSTTSETMTVHFTHPPQSDVTVNLTSSNPAVATVSPGTLTFTPSNHKTPQQVTVTGVAANLGLQNFDVQFATSSNDKIYDGLSDAWTYTSNTQPVVFGQSVLLAGFDGTNTQNTTSSAAGVFKQLSNPHKSSTSSANVNATFSTTDAVVNGLQWVGGMTSPSTWGSATYTPSATTTNTGVFVADNAITCSLLVQNTGINQVTLEKLHFRLQRDNAGGGSANQATITLASGNLTASGPGVQALSGSNGAFNYDFDLSTILTDATLAAGESATFTLSFAPTDPAGTNRRIRVDNLALAGKVTESLVDNVAPTPDPMTWASVPAAVDSTSITMTATTASDPSGVEYFFDETSGNPGGSDSGWQDSPSYTDTGLQANTQYTYTVTARDKAATPNATAASADASAMTMGVVSTVNPGTSNVVASPTSVPADGTTTSTITVTLRDAGGAPVSGRTVSLATNGSATIQTSDNTSNANGEVTFTVKSATVGNVTFTATGDAVVINQTAGVQFTAVVTPGVTGLLAGFDGYQTHQAIPPATLTSNSGVRQIINPLQDAGMAGAVSARIWTDQVTNKEFQWLGANQNSTTNGNWGLSDFATDAQTGIANFVITQQNASWINFELKNTGSNPVTLAKLHFAASRSNATTAPTQITITLEQNGTYANPPVLSNSPLAARAVGPANTIGLNPSSTAWTGYELAMADILSDQTLEAGETATFRIANNAGTARIYMDNFAISGSIGGGTPPANTFANWISGYDLGGQSAFPDDPDKDGLANGIESWFGTHPGEFSAGVLPGIANTGAGTFSFTHPLNDSPATDVTAVYRWSKDLSTFHLGGQSDPGGTTVTFTQGTPSNGRVPVTATVTGTAADRIFFDIKVTKN